MNTVFEFQAAWYSDGRSEPRVVKASKVFVNQYFSESELRHLFDGFVTWAAPEIPTTEMPGEAIGVWGSRKVSRFKRLLRQRGATFSVVACKGPEQHLQSQSCFFGNA